MSYHELSYFVVITSFLLCVGNVSQANETENRFIKAGLVDIKTINSSIQVDLVNADQKKNYFRENYYKGLNKAYLRKEIAVKLSKAQKILKNGWPKFSLLVLDAARPRSVSKMMYEKMKETAFKKYVANPKKGSMHNYGIAVDITIVDEKGREIDMGFSPFRKSRLELFWQFAIMKLGFKPNQEERNNRRLLSDTMKKAGFLPLQFEWWHFNGMPRDQARLKYTIVE